LLNIPWKANEDGKLCPYTVTLTPEAREQLQAFWRRNEANGAAGGSFEHLRDWASKLPAAVGRIAALLHLARYADDSAPWEVPVSAEDMQSAIALGDCLAKHALIAFAEMGRDSSLDDARAVLAWIRREGKGEFTRRDCHYMFKNRFPRIDDLQPALDVLCERGFIRPKPAPVAVGRGRPSMIYEVNPEIFT
jgi:hypothetical protein